MSQNTIFDIARGFGLSVETVHLPQHENAFRVLKGVNPIFIGTEDAVRGFLNEYERPSLLDMSMYGYRE